MTKSLDEFIEILTKTREKVGHDIPIWGSQANHGNHGEVEISDELDSTGTITCILLDISEDDPDGEKCIGCGASDDLDYCCVCGEPICATCCRVPDTDDEGSKDYCIPCYVKAGLSDLWRIYYFDKQYGDGCHVNMDVPVGTPSFDILHAAERILGPKVQVTRFTKLKTEEEINGAYNS